jgi:hypothetical protein
MLGLVGETAIATRVACVTMRMVASDTLPELAEIVAWPTRFPFTFMRPGLLLAAATTIVALLMSAMFVSDELQVTEAVRSLVVPSE